MSQNNLVGRLKQPGTKLCVNLIAQFTTIRANSFSVMVFYEIPLRALRTLRLCERHFYTFARDQIFQAPRMRCHVTPSSSGITRVSPTVEIKLVSPAQRGTM